MGEVRQVIIKNHFTSNVKIASLNVQTAVFESEKENLFIVMSVIVRVSVLRQQLTNLGVHFRDCLWSVG